MKPATMKPAVVRHALFVLLALLFTAPLTAQERILSYDSVVDVRADGSLDVTERITVRAEGNSIRRGIYRDFPTRYRDRYGNRVVVGFQMLDVQRNGRTEPWFTERMANGVRINTGNDDFLPVPADHTFTLRYRTTRQLGFFADHDELYWNAIGTGWEFPIERGSVEVRLPQPVPIERLHTEAYTGFQGAQGSAYVAIVPVPGKARWRLSHRLEPQQGLTVVLTFPKGVVTAPTRAQRIAWFLRDNLGVLVALAGLVALLLYCVRRWHRVGRDPHAGTIIARYEPPEGHSPAGLRYMWRMRYDTRCFSSDLLELAVDGKVRIHRDEGFLKDKWRLERTNDEHIRKSTDAQHALFTRLFQSGGMLELKNTNAATVAGAQSVHTQALDRRFQPELFQRHGKSIALAFAIAAASIGLALLVAFGVSGGGGVLAIIAVAVLMIAVLVVFAVAVKAPTPAGRKLLDEIEGLKLYLTVAERDDLARMPGPDGPPVLDAKRYERLLPYAVALEVEDAWTKKFTLAVGAAAAAATTAAISWYRGGGVNDLGSLSKAVGSSLSSQISSSSTPPGSSSGSGGGGSSGGGGGGGGGGGR
ncbi:MAG TPA: DUF2207 domain-containing protein [Lysobacter sp.]